MHILLWEIMTKLCILQKGTWRFQERYDFGTPCILALGFCFHTMILWRCAMHVVWNNRMDFE